MGFFYLLNSVIELDEERGCKNSVKSLLPQMSTSHLQFKKKVIFKLTFSPFAIDNVRCVCWRDHRNDHPSLHA
jgi:hypothetical protein